MNEALDRNEIGLLALAMIVMVLAHLHWLPLPLSGAFLLLLGTRFLYALWRPAGVPLLLRIAAIIGLLAMLLVTVGAPFGREGGSALLICLVALKMVETRTRRDARILLAVAFFTTMISFLFSQQMLATAYALVVAALLFGGLHGLTPSFGHHAPGIAAAVRRALPLATRLALAAIPLTVLTFMFFPRLSSPLWGGPWDNRVGKTGLSDRMQPGAMAGLWNDNTPVFRVTFDGPMPPPPLRYWRGPVLWDFDGSTWFGAERFVYETMPELDHDKASVIRYNVMMEATEQRWLFPLDMPVRTPTDNFRILADGQILLRRPLIEPKQYRFDSAFSYRLEPELSGPHRAVALRLPRNSNPKARALGESLRDRFGGDPEAITNEILGMIRKDFVYTLEPPPLRMDAPVDDFFFTTREGYCEHFSSAYVFLMRSAGIPARVVTGYMGGIYNPNGGYMLVRNSDAHAWAEYWAPYQGWVRLDPTGAVAPERISQGTVDAALPNAVNWYEQGLLGDLGLRIDWISASWRRLVIEFNADRQRDMLRPFGIDELDWPGLGIALTVFGALALAFGAWWSMRLRAMHAKDPLARAWSRFVRRLAKAGLDVAPDDGPEHLRDRATARWPDDKPALAALFDGWIGLRYGHADATLQDDLVRALNRWRPPKRSS